MHTKLKIFIMKKYYVLFSLLFAVFVSQAQTKHVLIEEMTGTWCQWCPRGTYFMDSLIDTNPNVIGIAIHVSDPMENSEYVSGCGLIAAPTANIDRGGQGANPPAWFGHVDGAFANTPKADVEVFTSFNTTSRLLTARVKASFFSAASGDYRLAAIVTEDGVTGPAPQYNQNNQYSGGGNGVMGGYELLPQIIPANMIAYDHVGRELLGGYDGQAGSVPSSVAAGDTASYIFSFTLPADWDENYIRVVGVLITPENTIDNAGKSLYLDGNSNAAPLFMSAPVTAGFEGSPYLFDIYASDPDDRNLTFTAVGLPSWLTLSPATSLGMIHTKATLSGTPTSAGSFPVEIVVSDGSRSTTLSFTIEVESALPGTWQLVGNQGFAAASNNMGMAVDVNGTLYALIANNNICNVYQKTPTGSWVNYGNLDGTASSGRIRIGADGLTPWVAFSQEGPVKVKKYVSGAWVQVGDSPAGGVQIGFDLDNNDVPYVALMDFGNDYKGNCFKYNGSSWEKLGGVAFSGSDYGTWSDVKVNKTTGDVYVLWNDFVQNLSYVSKYNGSTWSLVGGTAVSNDPVAYSQNLEIEKYTGNLFVVTASGVGIVGVLNAYKYSGLSWTQIGSDEAGGQVDHLVTTMNDDRVLLMAFVDISNSNSVSAMSYYDGIWEFIGPRGFSNAGANYCAITSYENMPYVLYRDAGALDMATVRYYDSPLVTGVAETPAIKEAMNIYPNPASHEISITGLKGPAEARIFNMQGALIWKRIVRENDKINTSGFGNGIYLLKTDVNSSVFIIQHN